jgi:hypothetical protein
MGQMTTRLILLLLILFLSCRTKSREEVVKVKNNSENSLTIVEISGEKLFKDNCASCHNPYKEFETAPALLPRVEVRSADWIYRFLTKRKTIINDTGYIRLRNKYKYHCNEFPNLTKDAVKSLINYIKLYVKQ